MAVQGNWYSSEPKAIMTPPMLAQDVRPNAAVLEAAKAAEVTGKVPLVNRGTWAAIPKCAEVKNRLPDPSGRLPVVK